MLEKKIWGCGGCGLYVREVGERLVRGVYLVASMADLLQGRRRYTGDTESLPLYRSHNNLPKLSLSALPRTWCCCRSQVVAAAYTKARSLREFGMLFERRVRMEKPL